MSIDIGNIVGGSDAAASLFALIGSFLDEHRLDPEPAHYEFAYRIVSEPDGPLAVAVRRLTDGGVRLTAKDIVALGGKTVLAESDTQTALHDSLVARTQMQVEGFHDLVRSVHAEASGFGRDLAASADAIRGVGGGESEVARLATAMIARVHTTETLLEQATRETAELREKLDEARDKARRDPLTGLPNRRAFEEAFAFNLAEGRPQCLAVCDIDKFKLVNDSFGHSVGDRVLRAIGEVINGECRGHMVARYGGEEFAVLFTDVPVDEAQSWLEAARATVANKRYRLRESDSPLGAVTFSAGLTAAAPREKLEKAFERADKLLYAAKNEGRNRVRVG